MARIASDRDGENLVVHPLHAPLLITYREDLARIIAELLPTGRWAPGRAYLCLAQKRSGGYRELVFPGLVDIIVGRCIIDALEPMITHDDGTRTFCGRSHASSHRSFGDYERWFEMWRSYSAKVAAAAADAGFTYVFDTDVADFFPSVDRTRAREFLATRTGAHASVLALLFSCLEAWLPRINYAQMTGLPIENNDVSRLVAHNYLKQVDSAFVGRADCIYLRYVDDTVIFAPSEKAARELKRKHHLALRAVGLNPNAAKSDVLRASVFEARRQREFNEKIDQAAAAKDATQIAALATDWRSRRDEDGWEPVMKRLYSVGRQFRVPCLRSVVASDVVESPTLADHALSYLARFDVTRAEAETLLRVVKGADVPPDVDIRLARFLCDAVFAEAVSEKIANMAVLRIEREEVDHGLGYAKGLWLLALHKHGKRAHRERLLKWASLEKLVDEQFRLHFMYVFSAVGELPKDLDQPLRHLGTSDIELTVRCCDDAASGRLAHRDKVLRRIARSVNGRRTIAARYLPLLRVMIKAENWRSDNLRWLRRQLDPKRRPECAVVKAFLERLADDLSA